MGAAMIAEVWELYRARDVVRAWTYRIVRARYKQSVLGGLWAVLQPAASVAVFSVIFTLFVPIDTGDTPYVLFCYVAVVPWTLLSTSISDMSESLVTNMNLVTKIYVPRELFPLSAMLARLFDFVIAFAVVGLMIAYYRVEPFPTGWLFIPVVLAIQLALALGLGLAGAALNVFYRDIKHVVALGLSIWFYASPIIYPGSAVAAHQGPIAYLYYLNPMAGVIEAYRAILLGHSLPGLHLVSSALTAATVLVAGYWFFKRVEAQFADVV